MTTYTSPFTGATINPAQVGYNALTISSDTSLDWPINGTTSQYSAANIVEVMATVGSLLLKLPTALQVSTGQSIIISNVGATTFILTDVSGNTIVSIAPGLAYFAFLSDNTTANGVWKVVQYGAGTSVANAGTLAGLGLTAIGVSLNQSYQVITVYSGTTLDASNRSQFIVWGGGVGNINLPASGSVPAGWFVIIRNSGTGILTVSAQGTDNIDGNASASLQLSNSFVVVANGTGFNSYGIGQSTQFAYTQLVTPVTGGTLTLTTAQAANVIQTYTGVLTSNQTIVLPSTVQTYYILNQTTGAFTLTFKTSGIGTSIVVPPNTNAILLCDGVNVVNASTLALSSVSAISLGPGTVTAPSLNFLVSTNTGVYLPSTGKIGLAAGGVQVFAATSTVATIPVGLGGGTF